MINVIVCGVAGRMGRRLAALTVEYDDLALVGATEQPGHEAIGKDVGEIIGTGPTRITIADGLEGIVEGGDVVLNFTAPEPTVEVARICGRSGKAMVVGTTGLSEAQLATFRESLSEVPCVFSPNFSVGVNLLFKLVEEAARILGDDFDVEVLEAHHHFKKDAPSGTAIRLAERAAAGLDQDLSHVGVYGREGIVGERTKEEIGIHAIRAGDIVGEHTVMFGGIGEKVELAHKAQSRDTFVMGALRAARFVVKAKPGLYDMGDVLGIK